MLPTKQRLFVSAYVKSRNATHAAIEAGYNKKWAGTNADKLLKNTNIAAAINEQLKAIEARSLITAERVLQE
ncbi:MAG: terminase small subunit, partial [Candidatus Competibacter denitrificans]